MEGQMTFKQLLHRVKKDTREAGENQNYPVEILPRQLDLPFVENDSFPLFDVAILLENIQRKDHIAHIDYNLNFSFLRSAGALRLLLEYS